MVHPEQIVLDCRPLDLERLGLITVTCSTHSSQTHIGQLGTRLTVCDGVTLEHSASVWVHLCETAQGLLQLPPSKHSPTPIQATNLEDNPGHVTPSEKVAVESDDVALRIQMSNPEGQQQRSTSSMDRFLVAVCVVSVSVAPQETLKLPSGEERERTPFLRNACQTTTREDRSRASSCSRPSIGASQGGDSAYRGR